MADISNKLLYTYTSTTYELFTHKDDTSNNKNYATSLVFDKHRQSIWTQGQEFGYATHVTEGRFNSDGTIHNVVSAIYTNTDGSLTYDMMSFTIEADQGDFYNLAEWSGSKLKFTYGSFSNTHVGTPNSEGSKQVLTYAWIDHTGQYTYNSTVLSEVNNGNTNVTITGPTNKEVINSIHQDGDGKISYTTYTLNTTFTTLNNNTSVDNISDAQRFVKDVYIKSDTTDPAAYTLECSYVTFKNQPQNTATTYTSTTELSWNTHKSTNVVLTNVNFNNGTLTYDYAYMPDNTVNAGSKNTNTTLSKTTALNVLTGITESSNGKITYTYNPITIEVAALGNKTTNNRTNYQYVAESKITYNNGTYTLENTYSTLSQTTSTGGINVNEVNLYSPVITYDTAGNLTFTNTTYVLPTTKYVNDLIKSNDALRYCGTATVSTNEVLALQHNTISGTTDVAHATTPDTTTGAVYKITDASGLTYLNGVVVRNGDMIISYSESASSTSGTGWNVINNNVDFSTTVESSTKTYKVLPSLSTAGADSTYVKLVNSAYLDPAGYMNVTYNYVYHGTPSGTSTTINAIGVQSALAVDGATVIQNIAFDKNGHMFAYTYGTTTDYKVTPATIADNNQHSVLTRNVSESNGAPHAGTTYIVKQTNNNEKLYSDILNSKTSYFGSTYTTYAVTKFVNGYNPVAMELGTSQQTYVMRISNSIPGDDYASKMNVITFVLA